MTQLSQWIFVIRWPIKSSRFDHKGVINRPKNCSEGSQEHRNNVPAIWQHQCEATCHKRDRWLAFLVITLALNLAALILFPDFQTDAFTLPLALICGIPSTWGFYTLLFFRTWRERIVGYFGVLPLVVWAACLVSLLCESTTTTH